MVPYARVPAKSAERTRKELQSIGALDNDYPIKHEKGFVLFPLRQNVVGFDTVERGERKRPSKPKSLKDALRGTLSQDEMGDLVAGFDIYGGIAVIEVPHALESKAKEIGEAILRVHPNLRTVCMKAGKHETEFRTMPVKLIAGEDNLNADYLEHGVRMHIRLGEVYFSPRLSTERQRIASLVKDGEVIAGFFAGVGPFPLAIAKQKQCTVYAVELNPVGVELMKENIRLNKLKGRVIPILGDVRETAKTMPKCDRVLMPLPKGGETFLEPCISVAKPGGIVHFYQFAPAKDHYSDAIRRIEEAAAKVGRKVRILNKKVVRPHAPRVDQIVIDFKVL
jgi:tRNA (guanine37-N1)-methyltransferase